MKLKKDVKLILLGMFLSGTATNFFGVLFNLYLKSSGLPESQIGIMISASAFGLLLGTLPSVWVVRRINIRGLLAVPLLLFAVTNLIRTFWISPLILALMAFLGGLLLSAQATALFPFLNRHTAPSDRAPVFGLFEGLSFGAGFAGSICSGYTYDLFRHWFGSGDAYRYSLSLSVILMVLALIPLTKLEGDGRPARQAGEPGTGFPLRLILRPWNLFSSRVLWGIVGMDLLVGAGAGLTIPYLNLYLKSRMNLPDSTIGLIFACVNGGTFLAILAGPFVARKIGTVTATLLSQFLSIFALLVLVCDIRAAWIVGAALVLRGGLMNMSWPLMRNLSMEIASVREQHALTAVRGFAWNLAWMISSFWAGRIIQKFGYNPSICMTALLYLISCLVIYFSFRGANFRSFGKHGVYTLPPAATPAPD